jgi:hypothetical protein
MDVTHRNDARNGGPDILYLVRKRRQREEKEEPENDGSAADARPAQTPAAQVPGKCGHG